MSNLLLSPVYQLAPDELIHEDKVFHREYPNHIIRIGTQNGVFWVECLIDQTLYQQLLQTVNADLIHKKCQIVDILYPDAEMQPSSEAKIPTFDPTCELAPHYIPISNTPTQRTPTQLADYLRTHTHTRYTGAGLSMHAWLPSMHDLKQALGVQNHLDIEIDPCLINYLSNPQQLEDAWMWFVQQMKHCQPTPAHRAIKELLLHYGNNIVTENTDSLHQQTGIEALMIDDAQAFRYAFPPEACREIDAIITVWLGSGDRWLLWWYKLHHPHGKIIAINKEIPAYCGADDIVILGDAQEILTHIYM